MKIAAYNVNGVNSRLPVLLRWSEESAPDIVCLHELKAPQEKFPEAAISDAGYDTIWHGQKCRNGVAILSRVGAIQEARRGLPGDPDDMRPISAIQPTQPQGTASKDLKAASRQVRSRSSRL